MLRCISQPSVDIVLGNSRIIETDSDFDRVEFLLENFEFLGISQFAQVNALCNNIDFWIYRLQFILAWVYT